MAYNWQQSDWPNFRYSLGGIEDILAKFAEKTGLTNGMVASFSDQLKTEAIIDCMVTEAIKSSAIEGEYISRKDVRSSIGNKFGLKSTHQAHDAKAMSIAQLMFDVRDTFAGKLTEKQLFAWHKMLFSNQKYSLYPILTGIWRIHKEPMQVVSGNYGRLKVHYEAPSSEVVPQEMQRFFTWFNATAPNNIKEIKIPLIRAAIAHLYFVTIHPFEDGNGRIGRALAEKALSQSSGKPLLLSLSQVMETKKQDYYNALQQAQSSNDLTEWIHYFTMVALEAQTSMAEHIKFILQKTKFFDSFKDKLSARQLKVMQRMLREGLGGFKGGMSAKKYETITGVSKATATRDLQNLVSLKAVLQIGSGRSVRYQVNLLEKWR